ncbi:MAG TPA: hypothetical protein DDW52_30165 [Planctomycetaceae bacterium]|nr:hypothetical protein [Planctomycetaceae bacterium]
MPPIRTHRRPRVALLVQTASHWSREVLFGVGSYAREQGGWEFFSQPRGFHESLELPPDLEIDGVVCRLTSPALYESLIKRAVPCVNVSWLGWEHTDIARVCSDELGCARLAADFYCGKDYRSIGYIGPPSSLAYSSHLREVLFARAKELESAIPLSSYPPYDTDDFAAEKAKVSAWLSTLPPPTALVVWNTYIGRVAIEAANDEGLVVPDDVAILAIEHDNLLSSLSPLPISYIDQLPHEVGYRAGQQLHRLMLGEAANLPTIHVPPLAVYEQLSTNTQFAQDEVVRSAMQIIEQAYAEPINIGHVATNLGVSRRTLEYRFKRTLKRSPAEQLRRVRLKKVQQLLGATDLSVEQIAYHTGFSHPAAMIRSFKRELGMTPTQYRRRA